VPEVDTGLQQLLEGYLGHGDATSCDLRPAGSDQLPGRVLLSARAGGRSIPAGFGL
jgi:hypothetical protein